MIDLKKFKYFTISALAFGTWRIGGGYWYSSHGKDNQWKEAIRTAIENGITTLDTAEMYGNGHAEELIGEVIKDFHRDELFIISKVWPNHASFDDTIKSAKESSRRLGTYIDLYLLHFPSRVPICDTIRAFEKLVDDGVIRYYGVSNFDYPKIQKIYECSRKYEISAVENHYSLISREDEKDVIPFIKKNNLLYLAYTPLENGIFNNNTFLDSIGKKYEKSAIQVALNWYISINNLIPIVKASSKEHVIEDAKSMGWRLSNEDWNAIDQHFKTKNYFIHKIESRVKSLRPWSS
ncbi:aldo/keto reductase [Acidianus manzaensis]|uniref:Aldo/keto reductase n=1 Tax=Acidianus manzaensis TaxID=282676 RepID=A0A1W6JZ55_9CREN|nr:aldo/keto reductase [Acidianus manzaensis]ARM75484.1 aldo/keto reductase [Acidianus manzaensis]